MLCLAVTWMEGAKLPAQIRRQMLYVFHYKKRKRRKEKEKQRKKEVRQGRARKGEKRVPMLLSPWRVLFHPRYEFSSRHTEFMLYPWGPVFPGKWSIILCLVFIYFAVLVKNWAHKNILPGADRIQQGSQLHYLAWLSQFISAVPRAAVKGGQGSS